MAASLILNACVSPQAGQVRRKVNRRSWLRVSGSVSIPASIAVPVAGQRNVKTPIVSPRESAPEGGITFSESPDIWIFKDMPAIFQPYDAVSGTTPYPRTAVPSAAT